MKYIAVIKQWLPQSCTWKESFAGEYVSWEDANRRVEQLAGLNREGYIKTIPFDGEPSIPSVLRPTGDEKGGSK